MNVMNRKYIPVGMEIFEFETEDVIMTSTGDGTGNHDGGDESYNDDDF